MKLLALLSALLAMRATGVEPVLPQLPIETCRPFSFVLNLPNQFGPDNCTATLTSGPNNGSSLSSCGGCIASAVVTVRCPVSGVATLSEVFIGDCLEKNGGIPLVCPSGSGVVAILNMARLDSEEID